MNPSSNRVLILGASDRPDRYAYKALKALQFANYEVILVNPRLHDVEGIPVYAELSQVEPFVDTITLYVNPSISQALVEEILRLKPRRVIFNPGTENALLESTLSKAGIQPLRACTLVLLASQQF